MGAGADGRERATAEGFIYFPGPARSGARTILRLLWRD